MLGFEPGAASPLKYGDFGRETIGLSATIGTATMSHSVGGAIGPLVPIASSTSSGRDVECGASLNAALRFDCVEALASDRAQPPAQ
jgi:hypothetical protein